MILRVEIVYYYNPLPLPPAPALSPLFIVVTKAEVFVYNLALSLVLSEQVKQTHCSVRAVFLGGIASLLPSTLIKTKQEINKTTQKCATYA